MEPAKATQPIDGYGNHEWGGGGCLLSSYWAKTFWGCTVSKLKPKGWIPEFCRGAAEQLREKFSQKTGRGRKGKTIVIY